MGVEDGLNTLITMGVLLLAVGAFAGVLAGLLGVGGGIILVPAFFYVFQALGYPDFQLMQVCLATSLATIIVTSIRSVMAHNKKGAVDWEILRSWAPGIVLGAVVGFFIASSLRSATLQMIFGVLAIIVGLYMTFGKAHWRVGDAMQHIRTHFQDADSISTLYVVDDKGKLVDEVTLHDLVLRQPDDKIESLMDRKIAKLSATEDREEAVRKMNRYDLPVLPVGTSIQ